MGVILDRFDTHNRAHAHTHYQHIFTHMCVRPYAHAQHTHIFVRHTHSTHTPYTNTPAPTHLCTHAYTALVLSGARYVHTHHTRGTEPSRLGSVLLIHACTQMGSIVWVMHTHEYVHTCSVIHCKGYAHTHIHKSYTVYIHTHCAHTQRLPFAGPYLCWQR
jgi:hypothetical protein